MNNLEIQKTEVSEITNLEIPEKVISKEIIGSYLFWNNPYSLWKETIETSGSDYEKLEPIYNLENCVNGPTHFSVNYQDEKGTWKKNCCVKPKKVKYFYYLADYQPSKFKVKFLCLPTDNENIDFSQLLAVSHDDWKKQLHWLVEKLTKGQLIFGSKETEDKKIKNDFFQEYNSLVRE